MESSEEKVRLYIELKQKCDEILKTFWTEEPRKHGHWEDCSNGWMCSVCNEDATHSTDYCPRCGAKMDEVSDGEK